MLALTKGLRARGIRIVENTISDAIDVYLLNSIHFDISAFERASTRRPLKVVQRIDGPISLARGADRERDEECFRVNQRFASATILQSAWTHERIVEMGYKPVNPVQITNAVDPDIFGPGEFTMAESGKVRLISTSWSDNPRKGGTIYKWLDQNLDWGRFEYSFVGRSSEQFNRIRLMGPVPSEDLADQLRQNDIYVFASQFEACSNALLEALNCGLPALYFDSASNPEVVGYGGLPFKGTEDILGQLDTLCENRAMFRRLIQVPSLEQVTDRYIEVLRDVADVGRNRET
jgi:glycosyltransferase involved in cell wall biosynthesis